MICWNLCRRQPPKVGRIIHHLRPTPGKLVKNSAFLVATHWAAFLSGGIGVVNNSPRSLPAKPECGRRNRCPRWMRLGGAGFSIVKERAGGFGSHFVSNVHMCSIRVNRTTTDCGPGAIDPLWIVVAAQKWGGRLAGVATASPAAAWRVRSSGARPVGPEGNSPDREIGESPWSQRIFRRPGGPARR